ncbi:PRC-barrel domain-containing protein [Actinokineospora bangkokensis]|uniref:Photosystem reaction center subunit H n=1 Tax=Actinokineospora bangkokensis TaxID=1193682 RepID=A0A1Q9LJD7_9PSEU|nr:PRC-barrel domain-containing protein [Actinokineospora bangkokensis]OLR92167.1 photosystem reaction center subunit H [Actinokineospora bangkokensis]
MFPAESLRDWVGYNVVDPDGKTIGTLEAVYVDTITDEPSFLTVKVGFIGKHRLNFAPALGATVAPKHIRVQYAKDLVRSSPAIDTDGELLATDEPAIFEHFGLDYGTGAERRLARR